ncbi:selenocysteine-specific translation elongation factor [Gemmatimonadota bacterium]
MRRLILGTAGHIDHGKTALIKALTGVDTDRLKEEKERGITIDLGFAELVPREDLSFGVVDVPGHEGFIRNMLAGATGMDMVLMVVAADEGIMPQTREHLAIVRLLGVPRLVVAITKADLVEGDWLGLVIEEVQGLLQPTPYREAPIVTTSATTGAGLEELTGILAEQGEDATAKGTSDRARLPLDRVFTIRGTGTVVTGTLWSGALRVGQKALVLPGRREGRIRSLQVHGTSEQEVFAGARVAVGLTGSKVSHAELWRGQTLVDDDGWEPSWMLTARISILENTGWELEQGQRVRVHLGTAEVLARTVVLEADVLRGGEEGWVQLRLEEPLLARVRDNLVIRTYSPVTTLGGGPVAEVLPRKRRKLTPGDARHLTARLGADEKEALLALLETTRWRGATPETLPQRTGLPPTTLEEATRSIVADGRGYRVASRLFGASIWDEGEGTLVEVLERFHEKNPLRPGVSLEEARQCLPGPHGSQIVDALVDTLQARGILRVQRGIVALDSFRPALTAKQRSIREELGHTLREAGLSPPSLKDLTAGVGKGEVEGILRLMEDDGEVLGMDGQIFFWREVVERAGLEVVARLGGQSELGPADFRQTLPITRKHLLPLLRYFDTVGITTRRGESRSVTAVPPPAWGTPRGQEE